MIRRRDFITLLGATAAAGPPRYREKSVRAFGTAD
jgi:hypothetical protein